MKANLHFPVIGFLLICCLLIHGAAYGQESVDDYWLLNCDSSEVEDCGYVDKNGTLKIKLGKYPMCFTDTFFNSAIVVYPYVGFCAIDREEKILYKVFAFDNAPDELQEGLRRMIINEKIGFANKRGEIIIQPTFDFAEPFDSGMAAFCQGCRSVPDGEHYIMTGGLWGLVDRNGMIRVGASLIRRWSTEERQYEYSEKGGRWLSYEARLKKYRLKSDN